MSTETENKEFERIDAECSEPENSDAENGDAENGKKQKTVVKKKTLLRLCDCLRDDRVESFVRDYYVSRGKETYPAIAAGRWKKGLALPPIEVLAGIAKCLGTNISYILGMTDVCCPNELEEPSTKTLDELLEAAGMTEIDLVRAFNNNYKKLYLYRERLPYNRVKSLMCLSEATGLSMDFILGYTNYENWEMYGRMSRPFAMIPAGSGAYVVADKDIHGLSDVEAAISRGDGSYCLLSYDGESVIFPNGNIVSIDDEVFEGVFVASVIPEVK